MHSLAGVHRATDYVNPSIPKDELACNNKGDDYYVIKHPTHLSREKNPLYSNTFTLRPKTFKREQTIETPQSKMPKMIDAC